jgi:hypothetical protein
MKELLKLQQKQQMPGMSVVVVGNTGAGKVRKKERKQKRGKEPSERSVRIQPTTLYFPLFCGGGKLRYL